MRTSTSTFWILLLAVGTAFGAFAGESGGADAGKLAFVPGETPGEYRFDTGILRGVIRGGGSSNGVMPLEYVPTTTQLADKMGIFNYYRVFKTNHRFVESMRALPSEATLLPDGALRQVWKPANEHPYTLTAVYRWSAPDTLDVETSVMAHVYLSDFEVFLASYLTGKFPGAKVYVGKTPDGKEDTFMKAAETYGVWQAYPRDPAAAAIIQDGRWDKTPSAVDWAIMPEFMAPVIYRQDPESGVTVVTMAPNTDAFAVLTPCDGESHFSMYFSLFGKTLSTGERAQARTRMIVGRNLTESDILARYKEYEAMVSK